MGVGWGVRRQSEEIRVGVGGEYIEVETFQISSCACYSFTDEPETILGGLDLKTNPI